MQRIAKGSTDVTCYVRAVGNLSGQPETGLVNTDISGSYVRTRGARTAIAMATLASPTAAHADGGFVEVDATNMPGLYRLDLPDAAIATGADQAVVILTASDALLTPLDIDLIDAPATAANLTIVDAVVAAIKAKTDQLSIWSGAVQSRVDYIGSTAVLYPGDLMLDPADVFYANTQSQAEQGSIIALFFDTALAAIKAKITHAGSTPVATSADVKADVTALADVRKFVGNTREINATTGLETIMEDDGATTFKTVTHTELSSGVVREEIA